MCRSYCTPMKSRRKTKRRLPARDRLAVPTKKAFDPLAGLPPKVVKKFARLSRGIATGHQDEAFARLSRSIAMAHQDGRATVPSGLVAPKSAAILNDPHNRRLIVPAVEAPSVKPGPPVEQRTVDVIVQGMQFVAAGLG